VADWLCENAFLSETFVGFIAVEIFVPSEVLPFPRFNLKFSSKFCGLPVPGFRSKERKIYRYFVNGTTGFDTKKNQYHLSKNFPCKL